MEMIRKFITEPFDIVLSPTTTSQYIVHTSYLNNYGINITRSNYIDFLDMSSILSTNRLALRPLLQCFRCFDSNIWTLILLSIVLVSLISSLRQQSFCSLYEYMWNYSITLLKVNFQTFIKSSFKKCKLIIGTWLLLSVFFDTTFSSYFFDDMVSPSPITKIDSLDNLFDSDMRIVVRHDSALYTYLQLIDSPILDRLDTFTFHDYLSIEEKLFNGLIDGSLAYVNHKFILIFYALEMNDKYKVLKNHRNDKDDKVFMDWLHISNDGGGNEPFFMPIKSIIDKDSNNDMNNV